MAPCYRAADVARPCHRVREALRSERGTQGKDPMKIVMAVIKPFKLDEVRDALTGVGVHGLTVTEVKGYGRQKGHTEIYRAPKYGVTSLQRVKIGAAFDAGPAEKVVEAIRPPRRRAR